VEEGVATLAPTRLVVVSMDAAATRREVVAVTREDEAVAMEVTGLASMVDAKSVSRKGTVRSNAGIALIPTMFQ